MRCDVCHAEGSERAKFCRRCGTRLRATTGQVANIANVAGETAPEHRQITVVFCKIDCPEGLSERVEPEELCAIVHQFQQHCAQAVERFDGYVAQYVSDGILAYFGYPSALEKHASGAVLAGLHMVRALAQTSAASRGAFGVALNIRVGVHTGAVVVGEMGSELRKERLAVGEAVNLAARVQAAAAPDCVVLSDSTASLVEDEFELQALGAVALKGFATPVLLHRAVRELGPVDRVDRTSARPTALVGRAPELSFLAHRFRSTLAAQTGFVLIRGEPGIGKSRLVRALRDLVGAQQGRTLECRCSTLHRTSALYPLVELLTREPLRELLAGDQAAEAALTDLLASPSDVASALPQWAGMRRRDAHFAALGAVLLAAGKQQPTLLVIEDVQWADPSTLEWLERMSATKSRAALLVVATQRTDFERPSFAEHAVQLTLPRLTDSESQQMLAALTARKALPDATTRAVLMRADGVPLYLEELVRAAHEASAALEGPVPADESALPAAIFDLLTARIDRLADDKPLLQLAATIGKTFSVELLTAAAGHDATSVHAGLARLAELGLIVRDESSERESYTFKHALIQDAAYALLLRSHRQRHHAVIAHALIERFPEVAAKEPDALAQHYLAAGMTTEASSHWHSSAERALHRFAYREAVAASKSALDLLATLPHSQDRDHREVAIRSTLGVALSAIEGFSGTAIRENYATAYALCEPEGEIPIGILYGTWSACLVQSDLAAMQALTAKFDALASRAHDPLARMIIVSAQGIRDFYCGRFEQSRELLTSALQLAGPNERERLLDLRRVYGFEGYLYTLVYLAWCEAALGALPRATALWNEATEQAERSAEPYAITLALHCGVVLTMDAALDWEKAQSLAERQLELAERHGFPFFEALGALCLGVVAVRSGDPQAGLPRIVASIRMLESMRNWIAHPYARRWLAEAYLDMGRAQEALAVTDELLAFMEGRLADNQRPLVLAVRACALAALGEPSDAERSLRDALALSHVQSSWLSELRIGRLLAQLLMRSGRGAEADAVAKETRDASGTFSIGSHNLPKPVQGRL